MGYQGDSSLKAEDKPHKLKYALAICLVAIGALGMAGCVSFGDNSDNITDFNDSANSNPPDNYINVEIVPGDTRHIIDCIHPNPQELMLCKPEFKENLTYLTEKIGMDYTKELSAYLRYLTDKGPVTKEWIDQNMEIYRDILIIEEERGNFNRLEHVKGYLDILEENGFNMDATKVIRIKPNSSSYLARGGRVFITFPDIRICDKMYPEECALMRTSKPHPIEYEEEVRNPCSMRHENYHNKGYDHIDKDKDGENIMYKAHVECKEKLLKNFNAKYGVNYKS